MPTKTANPKTFLGIPLMRIFWLFIYSVVLCLLVGIGVWYFATSSLIPDDADGAVATTSVPTKRVEKIYPTITPIVNSAGYIIEARQKELQLKLIDILGRGDFDSLVDLTPAKLYSCSEEDLNSYGSVVSGIVRRACLDEGFSPISQVACDNNSPSGCSPIFMYSVGCFLCGPTLVGREEYIRILNEHSKDNNYNFLRYGPTPTDSDFYYLFQNSLGDYLLMVVDDSVPNSDHLFVQVTPISSSYSESEIFENLPTY